MLTPQVSLQGLPPQAYFPFPMQQHVIEIQTKLANKGEKKGSRLLTLLFFIYTPCSVQGWGKESHWR